MRATTGRVGGRWWSAAGVVSVAGLVAAVVLIRPLGEPRAAAQPAGGLAADLALVPADAAGFVHVRLADLWKNELFAGLRKTWERAGEKAIGTLDKQFVPAPSSLDRVTGFVLMDAQTRQPQPFGVVAFTAPFDPEQLAKLYLPEAEKSQAGGKTVYTDKQRGISVTFPDTRHVLIGMAGTVEAYLGRPVAKDGPMAEAIKLAAAGRPVVAAANIAALPIPPNALDQVPADFRPLVRAERVVLSLDLGAEAKIDVRAGYKDAAAAGDADKAAKALIQLGRTELGKLRKEMEEKLYAPDIKTPRPPEQLPEAVGSVFALGGLGQLDDLLADPNLIRRDGQELVFSRGIPKEMSAVAGPYTAVMIGLLLPAVAKVRQAAGRTQSMNNMKQLLLATHSYCDVNNGQMPRDITDKDGKPLLSWRVALLPYLEQQAVYQQFKLDEPWDSPNNKKMSQLVIKVFVSPSSKDYVSKDGYGLTTYKALAGPGTAFEPGQKLRLPASFTDGLSNTVFLVDDADAVPWAKPADIPYDPKKPFPKIVSPGMTDAFNAGMGDGSVRVVDTKKVSEKTLKAVFSRAGNEVLDSEW